MSRGHNRILRSAQPMVRFSFERHPTKGARVTGSPGAAPPARPGPLPCATALTPRTHLAPVPDPSALPGVRDSHRRGSASSEHPFC